MQLPVKSLATIRQCAVTDLPAIERLQYEWHNENSAYAPIDRAILVESISPYFLVAECGNEAIGYVLGIPKKDSSGRETLMANDLYVKREQRGVIRKKLIDAILNQARKDKRHNCTLVALSANPHLMQMYRRMGFQLVPNAKDANTMYLELDAMTRDEFLQAKTFMFSDVEREIQFAKLTEANKEMVKSLGVNPGGGNFLAALGLLCYTEFGGRLKFKRKKCTQNFDDFFDSLGPDYKAFHTAHPRVYDTFRCGMAHEYFVKINCTIRMLGDRSGIGIDSNGQYYFRVEAYCRDLKKAFDNLQKDLYGS